MTSQCWMHAVHSLFRKQMIDDCFESSVIPLMFVMRQDRFELSAANTLILVRKTVWKERTC